LHGDHLWVAWQVPAPGWREVSLRYPLPDDMLIGAELNDQLWHTIVDVLDLSADRLLARTHFPFHGHLAAAGVVAHPYFDAKGETVVELWSVKLFPERFRSTHNRGQ
jgi:hypothetical protein